MIFRGTSKKIFIFYLTSSLTLKADSVAFTFSALYWASGVWTLIASLITGCLRIVTTQAFEPDYFLELVQHHKITHVLISTSNVAELMAYEDVEKFQRCLESIDTFLVGGTKVIMSMQEKMNQLLSYNCLRPGFTVAYGLSELSGLLTNNGGYVMERLVGSEGKLLPNKKVRVIGKDGQPLGPEEHGEICIYSPYTWFGYVNNEDATNKALKDNWLYSGDIGYFDAEGFLHFCSRDNDVFKSGYFQIYPSLLEDVINRLPGVMEACVFGIPDIVAIHLIACVVIRKENYEGQNLTAKDIEQHVKSHKSSAYHLSGGVYFVNVIPKTASGKVQRTKVLEIAMKMKETNQ